MIKLLLLAVVPFITEHRNILPKTEVSTNFYGSVTGIVDKAYVEGLGIEPVDTQAVIKAANDYTDSATGAIRRVDGTAKVLPKYLWCRDFYDSYTNDAAWYYSQPQDYGHCSAMRDGDFLYRNLDWKFNDAADFIIRMFAGENRFASIGVANCGTNLTEDIITSGKPSRYYKCLPGHTTDGINENSVCAEVNVVDGDPQTSGWHTSGDLHPLAAVRWVLDHATNAAHGAEYIAANIHFPEGWSQNFHYMICDKDSTYIIENGETNGVVGKAVMTNFRLYPEYSNGEGIERFNALKYDGKTITNVWFTKCYDRTTNPPWLSEFGYNYEKWNAALNEWNRDGATKESHRNEHIGDDYWWQTVHTSIYDLKNLTLKIAVQETDDWYVFQIPSAGGVKPEAVKEIIDPMIVDATNDLRRVDDMAVYSEVENLKWTWTSDDPNCPDGWLDAVNAMTTPTLVWEEMGGWACPPPDYMIAGCTIVGGVIYDAPRTALEIKDVFMTNFRVEFAVNISRTSATKIDTTDDRLATTNGVNAAIDANEAVDTNHQIVRAYNAGGVWEMTVMNAMSAEYATSDEGGNRISTTYAKKDELEAKRDKTDAKCYEDMFTEWVVIDIQFQPSYEGREVEVRYLDSSSDGWSLYLVGGVQIGASSDRDRDSQSVTFVRFDPEVLKSAPTATRAKVASSNETFITESFVTNRLDSDTIEIGSGADAMKATAISIGGNSQAREIRSIAIGQNAYTSKERAIAIGSIASASHNDSIVIGPQAVSHGDGTFSVKSEIGSWYAGNIPVIEALFSTGYSVSNVTVVTINDAALSDDSPTGSPSVETNTYKIYYPDPSAPKPVMSEATPHIEVINGEYHLVTITQE